MRKGVFMITNNYFSDHHLFAQPAIHFLRQNMKEIVASVDSNLTFAHLKLMDCFFAPFIPKEVKWA